MIDKFSRKFQYRIWLDEADKFIKGIDDTFGPLLYNYGNVEHEVTLGDFYHLAPSSTICGRSKLKDNIFVGSNAVIIEKLSIAKNTIIGAGSVVLKSVDQPNKKLVGVPARII